MFILNENIAPVFADVHSKIKSAQFSEVLLCGGRGSCKSSFVSFELLIQLIKNKNTHAAVFRKKENRLRNSVFAQLQWAIFKMGIQDFFRFTVSPLEITYLPTNQKILFFGLDDPDKVKSIKLPFGYVAFIWFEEYDQFSSPDEIRSIQQSFLRGGDLALTFKTFNPPVSPSHWANLELLQSNPSRLVSRSSYLDVPPQWLGQNFIEAAQHLKEVNPEAYYHEYLGIANGLGGCVFNNIEVREISQAERNILSDRIYCGIDWGWYP